MSALVFEGDVTVFVQPSDVMMFDEYVSGFASAGAVVSLIADLLSS